MGTSVICISRATGAGGEEVARLVSERLGFLYVDEEIVARAAERSGIDHEIVADEERRKSLISNLLAAMGDGSAAFGAPPMDETWITPSSNDVRSFIRDAIEEVAAKGDVVIVAHAASQALPRSLGALRVLITASPETRAARVGEAEGLDASAAEKAIKSSDLARADYLKRFYGVKELPTSYDLVVNTDALSPERAADVIVHAASL